MRGGLVALGVILIILGVAWFLPVAFGSAFGLGGAIAGFCFWVILAPIFLIIGVALFIVGLVAPSPDARMPRDVGYPGYYPPMAAYPPPPTPVPNATRANNYTVHEPQVLFVLRQLVSRRLQGLPSR